jgi:hypothetical protein
MKIKHWFQTGELDEAQNQDDLLDQCALILSKSYAGDMFGYNVFMGEDGNLYQVFVTAEIQQISPPDCDIAQMKNDAIVAEDIDGLKLLEEFEKRVE